MSQIRFTGKSDNFLLIKKTLLFIGKLFNENRELENSQFS